MECDHCSKEITANRYANYLIIEDNEIVESFDLHLECVQPFFANTK